MTEIEKYNLLLRELAEHLKNKNDVIMLKDYKTNQLEEKLKEAEAALEVAGLNNRRCRVIEKR